MTTSSNGKRAQTALGLVRTGARELKAANEYFSWKSAWKSDAEDLLQWVLGREYEPDEIVAAADRRRFERAIARRAKGEPIPYITGWIEFDGLRIGVRKNAFVPRYSTEFMATEAVRRLRTRTSPVHVDLATGVGPVALAVANRLPRAKIYGVDLSGPAIAQATANAKALRLRNATFLRGDLYAPLPARLHGKVDVITIHPPYIAKNEIRDLPVELKDWEPLMSLTDGSTGLNLLKRTIDEAGEWLRPGGWLLVEIGSYLTRDARKLFAGDGFGDVKSLIGPMKVDRLLAAKR